MLPSFLKQAILVGSLLACFNAPLLSQTAPANTAAIESAKAAALSRQTVLRDAFIAAAGASNLPCPIPPPTIVITDIPSFGNYNPKTPRVAKFSKCDNLIIILIIVKIRNECINRNRNNKSQRWVVGLNESVPDPFIKKSIFPKERSST